MSIGDAWAGLQLDAVTDTGDLTQLFPSYCPAGVNPFAPHATGAKVRRPGDGILSSVQVQTDGVNGGVIEIWDVSGLDGRIDVSSDDVITDAQLQTLIASGYAKLVYNQNFTGTSGATIPTAVNRRFARGLAARYIVDTVTTQLCKLNLVVDKGYWLTDSAGIV